MPPILDGIKDPAQLKALSLRELETLAAELRARIIETCAENGGHLAPSLGVVELTIALHRVFDSPKDKIVWDVGHQAYAHKLLTGRSERFGTLRTLGGISGFPKRAESPHDSFDVGHSSTSISAALGFAVARDLKQERNKVLAVIGDGSMTGGLAFEGLNHAGELNKDLVVILNDNEMSISENVGALSNLLSRTITSEYVHRAKKDLEAFLEGLPMFGRSVLKIAKRAEESLKTLFTPGMLFEAFGFEYIGPIDGHDIPKLLETLENVKRFDDAVLIHVLTRKGKGYPAAEANPSLFHGVGPFDAQTGKVHKPKTAAASYTGVFGETVKRLALDNEKIVAVTAAMPDGTGLTPFAREFPERFFDVGIAEQHAVTFAAGLAAEGFRPVVALYSSFLQRGFDQLCHDVCLQELPVVFAIDRAGVVGNDGPTHHGVFDLSYLRQLPGLTVMAPKDENELQHMLFTALSLDGPSAVRYPRGNGLGVPMDQILEPLPPGVGELLREGKDGAILAVGTMVQPALQAAAALALEGVELSVMNVRFVKPLDRNLILSLAATRFLVTLEDNVLQGGFGTSILELLEEGGVDGVRVIRLGYPDRFIEQGEQAELKASYGLDAAGIARSVREARGAGGGQSLAPAPLDDPTEPSDRTDLSDRP